jgi:diaphanous 1
MEQTRVGIFLLRVLVLSNKNCKEISRLPITSVVYNFTGFPFSPNPFKSTAQRNFRICVPNKWYRRTKPRGIQSSTAPSDSTLRRLAEMESDEEEGEGTAKVGGKTARQNSAKDVEQRGLVTQGRLSSLFEEWTRHSPTSPTNLDNTSFTPDNRKSVSEPRPVDRATFSHLGRNNISDISTMDEECADFSETAFEEMLVSLTNSLIITFLQCSIGRTRTEGG